MLRAQMDSVALAAAAGVDVKTVNRWLAGRVPHKRTRAEIVAAYAHRADIPNEVWISLLTRATRRIDIVGYA